jgi:AcrR family transcriptional regulator
VAADELSVVGAVRPSPDIPALLPPNEAEGTRRRILESALELFAEFGYHGVSVKEIAEKTGIRAASMYAHFSSKEQVLSEIMLIGYAEHRDRMLEAVSDTGDEPVARLRALVKAHIWMHATYPLLATVGHQDLAALSAESLQQVRAIRAESERLFLDTAEAGQRAGVFTYPDVWLGVAAISGMGIRVATWYRPGAEYASRYSVDQVAEAYADFAVKLLT